jgi:hypothetical protein
MICEELQLRTKTPLGKRCSECHITKPYDMFYKQKSTASGYRSKCKSCTDKATTKYIKENREQVNAKAKESRLRDPNYKEKAKAYREKNADRIRERNRTYQSERKKNDPTFRLLHRLRCRVRDCIRHDIKSAPTRELLGCSPEFFKDYIESMFEEGMTWENYGHGKGCWHIDHVTPCASFDFNDPEQQKECFHYKNLQPLWAEDNWAKGSK